MPHMDKYKEITNDWNYYVGCMLTLLSVSDSENVEQSKHAHSYCRMKFCTTCN
jgi:hypothetical protein